MGDGIDTVKLLSTNGVQERDGSDKVPTRNVHDDLKRTPLFNFAAENPGFNVQNTGASIW